MESDEPDEATAATTNTDIIKPINRETVHRICSGQVVLSLAVAVKELIENSIDAGAKNIEVRLKDYGMESVEVTDNGSGICSDNFAALTLKHYTSKIREFSDLESVCTLGFRGEALSSLCALSSLTVITRHASSGHGTKIVYDKNGQIVSKAPVARPIGTTVALADLFSTLPVRRKEYVKNHKKEFNKMSTLLYAYCLVSKGVKFTCSNRTPKGAVNTVVSTDGSLSVRDNIISVFGAKQISVLIEPKVVQPNEVIAQEFGIKVNAGDPPEFDMDIFISSVVHGSGRSATDRQFYFINSRPCEPPKLCKLVNDIYRQFNQNQYPFVYLNIIVRTSMVDVNVTPDKRQIFLEKEKLLLATVKMTLLEAFKYFPSTYKMQNLDKGQKRLLDETVQERSLLTSFIKRPKEEKIVEKPSTFSLKDFKYKLENKCNKEKNTPMEAPLETSKTSKTTLPENDSKYELLDESKDFKIPVVPSENHTNISHQHNLNVLVDMAENNEEIVPVVANESHMLTTAKNSGQNNLNALVEMAENDEIVKVEEVIACKLDLVAEAKKLVAKKEKMRDDRHVVNTGVYRQNRKFVPLQTSVDEIRESLKSRSANIVENKEISVRFRTEIAPSTNEVAEKELQRQIAKDMFAKMAIIGQFNYAFIIARLDSDLFIIDQHASDEKYNFEDLQRNTVIESQVLVSPQVLQLTAAQEDVLTENIDVFKKNGFAFSIDSNAEATKKVKLTKVPLSKNCVFGKDDIDEMLYLLQECYNTNCRPSRIRGMFASRACRKSVMVGKPLTKIDMRKLVDHMGEIDLPWNCPHGRPTMRHLINLDLVSKE